MKPQLASYISAIVPMWALKLGTDYMRRAGSIQRAGPGTRSRALFANIREDLSLR